MRRLIALITALLGAGPLAGAATLCVNASRAPCHATIQAAVLAAGSADTVAIAPGLYLENVTIPPGRDGLRLIGSGPHATVIDPDVPNAGTGVRIESNGVEVAALGIRNGQQYGVAIAAGVQRVHVHDLRFIGVRGPSAIFAEPGARRLRIVSNDIRASGSIGIHLSGANEGSIVRANVVRQVDQAVVALGNDLDILANRVIGAKTVGLQVGGTRVRVADNVVERVAATGMDVAGNELVVRNNQLTNAGTLSVRCTGCTRGVVGWNSVNASRDNGFTLAADAPGLEVRKNAARVAVLSGFEIRGRGVHLIDNVATDAGTFPAYPVYGCFVVLGEGHHLERNFATRCTPSGYVVRADDVELADNVSTEATTSGFLVYTAVFTDLSVGNVLTRNRALDSNAAGFAVSDKAQATRLSGNVGSGNRYDFCDDGIGTDLSGGNTFATTSTVCDVLL